MTITRYILPLIMALCGATAWAAAPKTPFTAKEAFETVPMSVIHLLNDDVRADMIAYYEAGVKSQAANVYGSACEVIELTPERIVAVSGDDMMVQMFILNPQSVQPVIGMIETLPTPIADSNVHFYTSNWRTADDIISVAPTMDDWLTSQGHRHIDEVARVVPFVLSTCDYDPATHTLTFTNHMADFYPENERPGELQYLRPTLKYKWNGRKFKLQK